MHSPLVLQFCSSIVYGVMFVFVAHHDQQALQEKLDGIRRELEEEQGALDRLRRDASTRAEQDRGNINQLRDELARFKTRLEESRLVLILQLHI